MFEPLYRSVIANYDDIVLRDAEYQKPSYLFIYADDSSVENILGNLVTWKMQKGFEVKAVSKSVTGSSSSAIKNYIQNAYNTWHNPPEFVCLVGDAEGQLTIPTEYSGGGEGDHYYTMLSGNDILADVFIGRISIDSSTDLQTIVSKIISYEKQPYTGNPQWFQRALLVGDPSSSGYSTISVNKFIKETILNANPEFEFFESYSGNYVNSISNGINQGVSFFNYRGFAGMSGWYNTNTNSLNNGYMLPFVMHLTCNTGNFATEEARSEVFLRAGTPSLPKGAIAAVGTATPSTHTTFNNLVAGSTYYGIFIEKIHHVGAALTRGKTALFYNYPSNPANSVNNFSYWNNLMGDPALEVWTAKPQPMNMEFPEIVSVGTNYVEIILADSDDIPLENVCVTALRGDDLFFSAYSDENGKALLPMFTEQTGNVTLTASKHNFIPVVEEISIQQLSQFVSVEDVIIIDDNSGNSSGNGDGKLNPNELIELKPLIKNFGTSATNSLTAMLSTENEFVTINTNEVNYPSIPAGNSIYSNEHFLFSAHENAPNKMNVMFQLTLQDENRTIWEDFITLQMYAAELATASYEIIDSNNGIADPGESIDLKIILQNIGDVSVNDLQGILSTENSLIEIEDFVASFGSINANGSGNNQSSPFPMFIKPLTLPGSQIPMHLQLFNSDGFEQNITFHLNIGEVTVTDPFGPDAFGYYAYDDGDTDYLNTPTYDWIEIDPNFGGSGTVLSMNDNGDNGDLADVNLPFVFPFYDINYNMITICSNGFIVPGGSENFDYMNRVIPGPTSPAPLIAPFWDDLKIGTGRVCYKYDSGQNIFIVQWSRLQNDYNGVEETFQAILYNPAYYPTSIGNGMIKFQYKVINNINQGQYGGYGVQHGQYSTVGLQDHTQSRGLQYTFDNSYPTAAKPLQNEMAILFTGAPIPFEDAYLVLGGFNVSNENGNNQLDFGEEADMQIILNNIGEGDAENVSVTISTDDPYLSILSNQAYYGTVEAESSAINQTPFEVEIAEQVPNAHIASIHVAISSNQGNWELILAAKIFAPEIAFKNLLCNDLDNYMLDPGETSDIFVLLENLGGSPITNATAILSSTNNHVTVNNATDETAIFEGDLSESFLFNISLDSSVSVGTSVAFQIELSADNYQAVVPFNVNIGLSMEGFESGSFTAYPWQFSGSGQWQISGIPFEGQYSAQSPDIDDYETTSIKISVNYSSSGQISFYRKISTEGGWDYLYFLVDGNIYGEWSGEDGWTQETYTIPPGAHTLEWRYDKDSMISSGSDCVWLDNIIFPMAVQLDDPILEFSESNFDLQMETGHQQTETFSISNIGGLVSQYMISTEPETLAWLEISPSSGYVISSETDMIYLHFDSTSIPAGEYNAQIIVYDDRNEYFIPVHLQVVNTSSDLVEIPLITGLRGNYPNPFNPSTTISFALESEQNVKLTIYNVKGQKVTTLLDEIKNSGYHQIVWSGKDDSGKNAASGMYLYRLETQNFSGTKKMLLIK
jgi:hypothetical protein